jgi:hypothetical protein
VLCSLEMASEELFSLGVRTKRIWFSFFSKTFKIPPYFLYLVQSYLYKDSDSDPGFRSLVGVTSGIERSCEPHRNYFSSKLEYEYEYIRNTCNAQH